MKTYLILGLLLLFNVAFAQINSGYVFINGKYIEPPYTIKQKQTGYIYINNELAQITITRLDTIANPYKQDKLPEMPKELTKYTTYTESGKLKAKETNKRYIDAAACYFDTHFPEEKAILKIKEFYKSLPNMKTVEGSGGSLTIETYTDTQKYYVVTNFEHDIYEKYGIHSHYKLPSDKELRQKASEKMAQISDYLNKNNAMFFRVGKNIINFYFPYSEIGFYDKLKRYYSNDMTDDEKKSFADELNVKTLDSLLNNPKIHSIFKKLDEKLKKTNDNNPEKSLKTGQLLKNKSTYLATPVSVSCT
jgi:ribosomal 50S subunit-recycling heat shock protein